MTFTAPPGTNPPERPDPGFLQKDIAQANVYRLEVTKLVIAMATGLLAFTVSFRPSIASPDKSYLMAWGWIALAIAITGGVLTLLLWEWFYISYRDYDNKGDKANGQKRRQLITRFRRLFQCLLFAGFIAGVASIGWFAAINIDKPPRTSASAHATTDSGKPQN
jgi:hypothetical protein